MRQCMAEAGVAPIFSVIAFVASTSVAQITNVSLSCEADAFVREAAPTNNYGRAGALSVAGILATNGFGLPGGRADSLARFRLNEVVASLDAAFGNHEWLINRVALRLYEIGAPNNSLFSRGIGAFEVRWLASGNDWQEGTGSPSSPTMDGVSFQDLRLLTHPGRDLSLGVFTNNGTDGLLTANLALEPEFVDILRSGGPTTLQFTSASDSIGFTFLSRTAGADLRIGLELTAAAGPQQRIASIGQTGSSQVTIRFNTRSNWTHVIQYCDVLPTETGNPWLNLFSVPVQSFDGQAEFVDAVTNRQRFYRLSSPQP